MTEEMNWHMLTMALLMRGRGKNNNNISINLIPVKVFTFIDELDHLNHNYNFLPGKIVEKHAYQSSVSSHLNPVLTKDP